MLKIQGSDEKEGSESEQVLSQNFWPPVYFSTTEGL